MKRNTKRVKKNTKKTNIFTDYLNVKKPKKKNVNSIKQLDAIGGGTRAGGFASTLPHNIERSFDKIKKIQKIRNTNKIKGKQSGVLGA